MKILVLQLTRLGDIFLTWPTLIALRNKYPEAQIDLLVRSKFAAATKGLPGNINIVELNTANIIGPMISGDGAEGESLEKLDAFVSSLKSQDYNKVINLSFSPASSYLTERLESDMAEVRGYSRTADGYLSLKDDPSAYFYSQVGIGLYNKAHVADLFAAVAGVEFKPEDMYLEQTNKSNQGSPRNVVIHIGASQSEKSFDAFRWQQILKKAALSKGFSFTLVGSQAEMEKAEQITQGLVDLNVTNKVGKTSLEEVFQEVRDTDFVVGCDSMVMHIAGLLNKRSLNFSFSTVNLWETGPLAEESRVIYFEHPESAPSDFVAEEIIRFSERKESAGASYEREDSGASRFVARLAEANFAWELTQAIYMEADFPICDDRAIYEGLIELARVCQIALVQLDALGVREDQASYEVLNQTDTLIKIVAQAVPELSPLVNWFFAEKIRIEPGEFSQVLSDTRKTYEQLATVLKLYTGEVHADAVMDK